MAETPQVQQPNIDDPNAFKEEQSNFNIMEWLMLFLHYWYLFVISLIIAFGYSMYKNRSWIENWYSRGTVLINETGG